jgi:hypothetical protein
MECRVCHKTKGVKRYGFLFGINLDYCEEHNYIFRDLKELNKISKGSDEKKEKYLERRKKAKEKAREKKWNKIQII